MSGNQTIPTAAPTLSQSSSTSSLSSVTSSSSHAAIAAGIGLSSTQQQQQQQQRPVLYCSKHTQRGIRFICSMDGCTFGNLICDQCLNNDPRHFLQHKSQMKEAPQFIASQTKMTQILLPSIQESISQIEKVFEQNQKHLEAQEAEIEKDFAQLFKSFFSISELAKKFLKDQLKNEVPKFIPRLGELKAKLLELNSSKKKDSNIFNMLFSRESEEMTSVTEENILKLIKKNAPLNKVSSELIALQQELDKCNATQKIYYKNSDESKKAFHTIQDTFESSTKDVYRKLKHLLDGAGEEDLRRSVFAGMKASASSSLLSNSMVLNKSKAGPAAAPMVVSIDLSNSLAGNSAQLKKSVSLRELEGNKKVTRTLKRVPQFPSLTNEKVLQAIRINGSFSFKIEDSYMSNQPEQGPFEMEDGSIYYGHISDQKRCGRGKAVFKDGAYYEGFWKDDIPYGMGRIVRNNGDLYQGQCINFKAHGVGVFKTLSGDYLYQGEWVQDLKHGKGEETVVSKYQYIGEFSENLKHGNGVMKFIDGSVYTGEFKDGEITGEGQFEYENGEKYVGNVKNGQKTGKGSYIWPEGNSYDGFYLNNIPHGQGIYVWADGIIYNGNWQNGLQHGVGLEIDTEQGTERQGEWENGVWKKWV